MYISLQRATICMKCHIVYSGKNKKRIISLSSAKFAHSSVSVNMPRLVLPFNNTVTEELQGTDNPLYTDTRYNDKIHYNDNLTVTKPLLMR